VVRTAAAEVESEETVQEVSAPAKEKPLIVLITGSALTHEEPLLARPPSFRELL
jgi:hypothetical protein